MIKIKRNWREEIGFGNKINRVNRRGVSMEGEVSQRVSKRVRQSVMARLAYEKVMYRKLTYKVVRAIFSTDARTVKLAVTHNCKFYLLSS